MSTQRDILTLDETTPQGMVPQTGVGSYRAPVTLDVASGNEIAFDIPYTTNKAAGNDTGLRVVQTDTASGGISMLFEALVLTASKFSVTNTGVTDQAGQSKLKKGADVVAASELPVLTDGNYFDVTGATGIATIAELGIGTMIALHFDAGPVLTHSADLVLPTAADITAAVGDEAIFVQHATGDWRCIAYMRASGMPVASATTAKEFMVNQMDAKATVFDDFIGTWTAAETLNADMWLTTAGSGANTELGTTVANSLNGEITMKSSTADGATSANATNFTGVNLGYKANQGGLVIEARLKIDDITEAYIFVGFTDVLGSTVEHPIDFTDGSDTLIADADNACGIVFSGDATTQEWCHGGVAATTPTTAAFSSSAPSNGAYVVLRVEVSATGGVRGFVDGVAIGAEVASAVTASTALTPAVVVSNTAAAATIMTLDYIWTQQDR